MIDEIGKMEMFSSSFVQTVRSLTAHVGSTVLATIPIAKGRPIPLVEELRHSADAKLVVVKYLLYLRKSVYDIVNNIYIIMSMFTTCLE